MAIDFACIQPHLQQSILKKCDFIQFVSFLQCSKSSQKIAKKFKRRLPWNNENSSLEKIGINCVDGQIDRSKWKQLKIFFNRFPIKIDFQCMKIEDHSEGSYRELIKLFEGGLVSTNEISFSFHVKRKPELFRKLLKVSKVRKLACSYVRLEFLHDHQLELQNMSQISLTTFQPFPFDIILTYSAEEIRLCEVIFSSKELNIFLKKWYNGTRNIRFVNFIYGNQSMPVDQFEAILEGIPYELIWSKEFHSQSVVSDRPIKEIEQWGERNRFYALKRGNEQLLVELWTSTFRVSLKSDPIISFLSYFNSLNKKVVCQ